ncbi:MAG: M28 family peptidase, partial [Solobacterium sp.]|nr:M28 family peptidase [Solobacterium sp.]
MEYILKDLEPKLALKYFEDISAIPRGSYNEAAAARFVAERAEALGLYHRVDEKNNVVVKKSGSPGCEDQPAVLLQAHLDMVCEKNSDTVHDFTKDGLKLVLNGDILTADGTTLGADDGKGVAYMLALMDSDSDAFPHPPLEFLFTTGEEVG